MVLRGLGERLAMAGFNHFILFLISYNKFPLGDSPDDLQEEGG